MQYLQAPTGLVLAAAHSMRSDTTLRVAPARAYPDVLEDLLPFEAPWTRELVLPFGDWTAYLNNFVNGGDPTAIGPAMAQQTDGGTGDESGHAFPFEDAARYAVRRIRSRFDRDLLVRYLDALGIPADDDDAYGAGVIVQQVVDWPRRTLTLHEARTDLTA